MNNINPELHLFIIWERALYQKKQIIEDIGKNFKILNIYNIQWDQDNYSNNLTRFYGENLPNGSEKELECGNGRFSLIVVMDNTPSYSERATSKGVRIVNVNMFDSKTRYRAWTGGGHKIHATNDINETRHDLFLLLGMTYEDCMTSAQTDKGTALVEENINRNITGCIQWESLQHLFLLLNQTTEYVVLRNFDRMPESYYEEEHGDIDILVNDDPVNVSLLMNATPLYSKKYRVHYKVNINNETVRFDIRHLGDGYYDENWERHIIERRTLFKGFYVPDLENFKYSLLYHALVHKPVVSEDYSEKLASLGFEQGRFVNALQEFMCSKGYSYSEPRDLSVHFNATIANRPISLRRKIVSAKHKLMVIASSYLSPVLKAKIRRAIAKFLSIRP